LGAKKKDNADLGIGVAEGVRRGAPQRSNAKKVVGDCRKQGVRGRKARGEKDFTFTSISLWGNNIEGAAETPSKKKAIGNETLEVAWVSRKYIRRKGGSNDITKKGKGDKKKTGEEEGKRDRGPT